MDQYPYNEFEYTVIVWFRFVAKKTAAYRFDSYLHHKDHEGSNALHLAVVNNQYENVKLLLEAGAQVNYPKVRLAFPQSSTHPSNLPLSLCIRTLILTHESIIQSVSRLYGLLH